MRIRLVVGFALAAFGASTLACSSSSNPYADVSEYCSAYAKAICQISSTCQFDPSACETYQTAQCNEQATQATAAGTRTYTPGNVSACINALNAAYGNNATSVSASALTSINTVCAQVFVGSAGEGASCTSNFDCTVSGDICASAPGISGQTCAKPTPKQLNDVCADPGDQCPSDAYCAAQNGTSKCVPAQADGATCSATEPCVGTDYCNASGICAPLAPQGQPCTTTANCSEGLICDTYTSSTVGTACVTALTFARGSVDCEGIEGLSTGGSSGGSSGSSSGSGSGGGDAGGGDSGGSSDGATGG
jgi:hypothetical protein